MTNSNDIIAKRLKRARINAGYRTAKEFCLKNTIKNSTYGAHESGRNALTIKTAEQYAQLLGVTSAWLLTGENEESKSETSPSYQLKGKPDEPRSEMLNRVLSTMVSQWLKDAELRIGNTVADFGCGTGGDTALIARKVGPGGKVYAIDCSHGQIGKTRRRMLELDLNHVECIRADVHDAVKNIDPVDVVYMRNVLYQQEDPMRFIEDAYSLLKPEGTLICIEPVFDAYWLYPESETITKATSLYKRLSEMKHFNLNLAKVLYQELVATQRFDNFKVLTHQYTGITPYEKSWVESITIEYSEEYVEEGLIASEDLDVLLEDINKIVQDEQYMLALPQLICIICHKIA